MISHKQTQNLINDIQYKNYMKNIIIIVSVLVISITALVISYSDFSQEVSYREPVMSDTVLSLSVSEKPALTTLGQYDYRVQGK